MASPFQLSDVSWIGKTYPEIQETAQRDGSVLVIPIGSVEQHGHHMPVGTDIILADSVARAAAERVQSGVPILISPPVWSGHSPHHTMFGGTISINFDNMLDMIEDVTHSALDNGFDAVLLLNGHGGNMSLIDSAVYTVGIEREGAEINALSYFELADEFIDSIRDSDTGGISHAGEFETSLMMHLFPELVREDRMEDNLLESPYDVGLKDLFEIGPLTTYRSFDNYSPGEGTLGKPSAASESKGAEIFNGIVGELSSLLQDIHNENR